MWIAYGALEASIRKRSLMPAKMKVSPLLISIARFVINLREGSL